MAFFLVLLVAVGCQCCLWGWAAVLDTLVLFFLFSEKYRKEEEQFQRISTSLLYRLSCEVNVVAYWYRPLVWRKK